MRTAIVISTYNWPAALELCLESVRVQSQLPQEIIIADDGSTADTAAVIETFRQQSGLPVKHVWQEDKGFRLARIRNKSFAATTCDYVIQVDGDLVLHRDFVRDHLALAKPGYFVTGSRVLLSPETTSALLKQKSIDIQRYSANNRNFFNGLRIPFLQPVMAKYYKLKGKNKYYVKGCNMAFWLRDFQRVNGYNEAFTGWGREDSELAIRLMNAGVRKQFIKFGGVCYHLFHKEASRELEQHNREMMRMAIHNKTTFAEKGLSDHYSGE